MTWNIGDKTVKSRLLLGTARYPTMTDLSESIEASETNILTISLRRENADGNGDNTFFSRIMEAS